MLDLGTPLPARSPELAIRQLGDGRWVVKNPRTGDYFQLGAEEHFLLAQLDGDKDAATIRQAFAAAFGQPLADGELEEFLATAREQGLLQSAEGGRPGAELEAPESHPATPRPAPRAPHPGQSLLYWRKSLLDPDRLFSALAPRLRFFWTPAFVVLSAGSIMLAAVLLWAGRHELAPSLAAALRWETLFWAWLVLGLVTALHESAHGLTCKHFGGEVHEIGLLLLFFMPCCYCNVSDAWLLPERSRRLWVTFAGAYFELFLWSVAVIVWRLTLPGSFPHYLAFLVVASSGIDTLLNFNPLLKLDGYYLLSDALDEPNLRQRSLAYLQAHLRRLLWGAPRPEPEPRGRLLLVFGLLTWLYSLVFLVLMLWAVFPTLGAWWGWWGMGAAALLGLVSARGLLQGISSGEINRMIASRRKRTVAWLLGGGGLAAVLCLVEIEDWAGGPFLLRPAVRAEVRAPVAGFLKEVHFDQGERVSPGVLVARLEAPDLESRLAQKQAEVREVQARLRLLEAGTRPEELAEQRQRVERARAWRDLARRDLAQARQALNEELDELDKQIAARQAELEVARASYARARSLFDRKALPEEEYQQRLGQYQVSEARLAEARAAKRAHQARAVVKPAADLAWREKELADARATLRLLEAGTRPEEIDAERARLDRMQSEAGQLDAQRQRQFVAAPVPGLITTARLKEKLGQYLREGDLICLIEEPAGLEAEITLAEQHAARVRCGQHVRLKARALPFQALATQVDRIAPAAARGDVQSSVAVSCALAQSSSDLRPEMTGHARIYTGRQPIGKILLERGLRLLRTEFWW